MSLKIMTASCLALLSAQALADHSATPPHPALRLMMTAGMSTGGDKMSSGLITVTDAQKTRTTNATIYAGRRFLFGTGLRYQKPGSFWSAQLTANYHTDYVEADNGGVAFERFPIELLGHYQFTKHYFVGGGLRYALHDQMTFKLNGAKEKYKLTASPALVLEAGYNVQDSLLMTLRLVKEEYKADNGVKFKGDHVGLNGSYLF